MRGSALAVLSRCVRRDESRIACGLMWSVDDIGGTQPRRKCEVDSPATRRTMGSHRRIGRRIWP